MTGKLVLVTGGARSGKSSFAEGYVKDISNKVAYIATSIPFDEGMQDRVKKHKEQRPSQWTTVEKYFDIHKVIGDIKVSHDVALLDCLTIMCSNIMFADNAYDFDTLPRTEIDRIETVTLEQINLMIEEVRKNDLNLVIVTNELGMGIVPENRMARIFRDIAGKANQLVASKADEVFFVVSGIPMKIK